VETDPLQDVTLQHLVDLWYALACTSVLTRPQLDRFKILFDSAAQRFEGTLTLLRIQTTLVDSLNLVVQEQARQIATLTEEVERLRTGRTAAQESHREMRFEVEPPAGLH
jgi:hypothetical protein